jgi:beta-mannosidase
MDSHYDMLRIWGGGNYETDLFYDICDEAGILFANAMPPGDKEYQENVREEIKENVIRLRNHPSIALWVGNNEIMEGWYNWGW